MAKIYDTLLGEYLQNPGRKWLSLDDLSKQYFEYEMISYEEVVGEGYAHFWEVPLYEASEYSAEDVYITKKIYDKQKQIGMVANPLLEKIELPLIQVLTTIELSGVKVSKEKLSEIGQFLKKEILFEEGKIFELAWVEFNIKSPKQVWEILFDTLGLPQGKKTKTGYSVDSEVLEYLAHNYPIAQHISNYRQYQKLLSTYIEWLSKLISPLTGRIHTSYNQTVTTTGRLSSTNPNLQNIPVSNGLGWSIREAFIPYEKEDIIVSFDYSQIEVRLLAIMSGDENLLGSFKQNIDIHKNTGYFLFWKDEISSDERKIAKAVNFWVIYGISPFWLSKMIGIPQSEAKVYIDKFYERYPKVRDFFTQTIEFCEKNGYVETIFWRKRYIPSINDRNTIIKKAWEREAINMPIQGTSADIIKLAMVEVQKFLDEHHLQSKMMMQVHDELVFNVIPEEFELIQTEIPKIMENIIEAPIELKVDMWYGKNWRECK